MRIVLLCPSDNTPTGGIKVIYRHCELFNALGVDAVVMHPFDTGFRCNWFTHAARFASCLELDPAGDFVIVPELWALPFGRQCLDLGVRYGMFVQNGYLTHAILPSHTRRDMECVYENAALILSISSDTTRMVCCNYPGIGSERVVPMRYSIGAHFIPRHLHGRADVRRRISFMPRKLPDHAARVVYALCAQLPSGWHIVPIQQLPEAEVAKLLSISSIFMSFSDFEGLPLPPLEAAIAGNLVIGYTGRGAMDYWREPNFREVRPFDIIDFVETVLQAARDFERGAIDTMALACGAKCLAQRYSAASETEALAALIARIEALVHTQARPQPLQEAALF